MEIQNKIALVTGAGRRLGQAIALALGKAGANVAVHYHTSREGAEDTAQQLRAMGRKAALVQANQEEPAEIQAAVDSTTQSLGPVDILVNSAAIFHRMPFPEVDLEWWDRHLDTNLRGPWLFMSAVAEGMKKRGAGKIVNIIDAQIWSPRAAYLPYSAAKSGLITLTKGLARTLAPGIQVNGVSPGIILPPPDWDKEEIQAALAKIPMRRMGTPEDVAATVVFLVTGPDFITGAIIPVDGGQSLG